MNNIFNFENYSRKRCLIIGVDSSLQQEQVDMISQKLGEILRPLTIVIIPGLQGAYGVTL